VNEATRQSHFDAALERPGLRRVLGTPMLVLYGLGVIIGAGIYVLLGTIVATAGAGRHGRSCWLAFLPL
jgi:basic amino acid/polyamine antiporter, APA family